MIENQKWPDEICLVRHGQGAGSVLARKVGPLGFLARELLAEIPGLMRDLGDA